VKPFGIDDAGLGDAPGVTVHGEIDISAVGRLDDVLDTKIRTTTGAFVIDLTDVDFIDSSGLAALMRARGLLGREDRQLAIICRPGPVRRIFELSGTAELFVIYGSREEALSGLVPAD